MKTKVSLDYPKSAAMGFFSEGPKKEFETTVVRVNEPPVFRPLKFYYTYIKGNYDFFILYFFQVFTATDRLGSIY